MRLNINLASHPYEDARQFWLRWGMGLAAASILTIALIVITVSGWLAARKDRADIAILKARIEDRDRDRQKAEDFLNRPENRSTRDQSQFLNQLIERKSFSWTRVLEDLEKVMPARVHLVAIHPELDDENQLELKLSVAGDSHDRALELARRMEDSRRFTKTFIASETFNRETNGGKDPFQFGIEATYVPETVPLPNPAPGKKAENSNAISKPDTSKTAEALKTEASKTETSKRTTP
jgi:type IV pilus assembly protein PilN